MKTINAIIFIVLYFNVLTGFSQNKGEINKDENFPRKTTFFSSNQKFSLAFEKDGNLVLTRLEDYKTLWESQTKAMEAARVIFQKDGNLIIYDFDDKPIWKSNTDYIGDRLVLENDGNLVIYSVKNRPVWSTNTAQVKSKNAEKPSELSSIKSKIIKRDTQIKKGTSIESPNKKYFLSMQEDGNLVMFHRSDKKNTERIWSSKTEGKAVSKCIFQPNGNFVLLDFKNFPIWSTGTENQGMTMGIYDDGHLVVLDAKNSSVWRSE